MPSGKRQCHRWVELLGCSLPFAGDVLAVLSFARWARESRRFGVSVSLATRRSATLWSDVISQANVPIVHHLPHLDDLKAISHLTSPYAWS